MDPEFNYVHNNDTITFKNNVRLSKAQFDALHFIKGESMSVPSFLWQELRRLEEEQKDNLEIRLRVINFKRNKKYLDLLVAAGFFKMESEEEDVDGKKKIKVRIYDMHPAIRAIIPLM